MRVSLAKQSYIHIRVSRGQNQNMHAGLGIVILEAFASLTRGQLDTHAARKVEGNR